MSFQDEITHIIEDGQHGSSELLTMIFDCYLKHANSIDVEQIHWSLETLVKMDASMVIIQHFLIEIKPFINDNFLDHLNQYISKWQNVNDLIYDQFNKHFSPKVLSILTHSRSGAVSSVISRLKPKVIQTISEPGTEGIFQAESLLKNGINVQIIHESQVMDAFGQVDCVLLGCDQFDDKSFINKVGSKPIVESAIVNNKPVCILADSRKKVLNAQSHHDIFEKIPLVKGLNLVTENQLMTF